MIPLLLLRGADDDMNYLQVSNTIDNVDSNIIIITTTTERPKEW